MNQNVCRKNKFGYCSYVDTCHYRHINEICSDENCSVFNCEERHPRMCNYFKEFGRCKFTTYCKYDHTKEINIKTSNEKLLKLEKEFEELRHMEEELKVGKSDLEKQLNEEIVALEKKVDSLVNALEKKDSVISSIEKKFNQLEKKITDHEINLEVKKIET